MSDKIDVNYEQLQQIAKMFDTEADGIQQVLNSTKSRVDALVNAGWKGRGSETFFAEQQNIVLPSLNRLVKALHDASQVTQKVMQIYSSAEEQAKNLFNA